MSNIVPIRDLRDTIKISQMCHETDEPIFITKNGYGDMVIMSIEHYQKNMFLLDVTKQLNDAETEYEKGDVIDAFEALEEMRQKYDL